MKNKIVDKLLQEFKHLKNDKIKEDIDAVVVLSAEEVEVKGENKERIREGLKFSMKKLIPLIFLGTKIHDKYLEKYAAEKNLQKKQIYYPVKRKKTSTKTQIKDLAMFLTRHNFKSLLIVSHLYHIPRIKRYCKKYLQNTRLYFFCLGDIKKQTKQMLAEIEKIIKYSQKNDLSLNI